MKATLSNLGFRIAMSQVGVAAVVADLLNGWESKTGSSWSTNTVAANTVDGDGYSKKAGILKEGEDITIKFLKEDYETYERLYNQYHDIPTSDPLSYVDFTFMAPKRTDWIGVKDYVQTCQITKFTEGDANLTDLQSYSITITPSGAPKVFAGMGVITSVAAVPDTLDSDGGNTVVTVTGTNLVDGILVRAYTAGGVYVAGTTGYTTGSATSQTVSIALPANASDADKIYTIKASKDNGANFSASTDTVTVSEPVV